ncbi:MAG: 4Fe-4S dicluster domain-containing protein [Victivallaceae bacterium]|nr:4Fe-4S dicluster domain-containing protein [Victivallaceae bacterium]
MAKTSRWVRTAIFLLVLLLGWRYPVLAYCMFLDVALGIAGAIGKGGRYGCGNYCPRGAFLALLPDTGRHLPDAFFRKRLSWYLMPLLLAGLIAIVRPTGFSAWGKVFYFMILTTTVIGIVGGMVFNRGFWCSVCPMGKCFKLINGEKAGIEVADGCVSCEKCVKSCPFGFNPPGNAKDGVFATPDCMRCGRCVEACPKSLLKTRS